MKVESIKKFKFQKFSGMKYKLILSFCGILILSVWMVLIANRGSENMLSAYKSFAGHYQNLSDFYREVESAESSAKAYLYDRSEDNLKDYHFAVKAAGENLDILMGQTKNSSSKMKYHYLRNMMETYDSLFEDIVNNESSVQTKYGFFHRIPSLIQGTYIEYAEMITQEMEAESLKMEKNLKRQLTFIGFIICLMTAGAITGILISLHSITRPISKLVLNIKKIENKNYQLEPIKSQDTEICTLSNAIVEMAESIQENIAYMEERVTLEKLLLQQENDNLKMNELLIDTQLKVLQDQMNPHFLFNTLNLISKMAYLEQASQTSELMEKTADLLRYSLDKSSGSSDLAGEIRCIRNYIEIQKLRFGHRICFELTVYQNVSNEVMPGMILQPLMENAVSHGVKDMMEGAVIRLTVRRNKDKINLILEDNGMGMDSELVEELMSMEEEASNEEKQQGRRGIGIRNVMKRLEMFYGEEGIMQIQSTENCGTVMSVIIPVTKEDDYVQAYDSRG